MTNDVTPKVTKIVVDTARSRMLILSAILSTGGGSLRLTIMAKAQRDAAVDLFELRLVAPLGKDLLHHVEAAYPAEGCGVGLVRRGTTEVVSIVPIPNAQSALHAADPARHPGAREAFTFEPAAHLRLLMSAEAAGLEVKLVFHSHCDAAAYLSPRDRLGAVYEGVELVPGAVHVVISVRQGHARDAAAYRYRRADRCFEEQRLERWVTALREPVVCGRID